MTIRFLVCAALIALPAAAQSPAPVPRLSDGKPDFSGVWDGPRVSDVTRNGRVCANDSKGCKQEGSGELSMTAWGLEQFNNPHKFEYSGFCQPWGYTRAWQTPEPIELLQKPQRLVIMWELDNVFHVVPTDGRDHPKDLVPVWMGNSVGKWDGDTLIVDTIGFNGKTWIDSAQHPMSDQLHVVERLHYVDADHLGYEVTWEDPKAYTKPFRNNRIYARMKPGSEIMEWWCMENNKTLLEGRLDGKVRK